MSLYFFFILIYNKCRLVMFMEKYNVKFKKKLGQNFLKDKRVVNRIVDVSDIKDDSLVIEVGPGGGIMTKELAQKAKHVVAYEIDSDLQEELSSRLFGINNVEILFQDFLLANISNDLSSYSFTKLYFVSNVPYYITTPIILKLIKSNMHFENIVMMVQKEVGERFSTLPGNRDYGSITVLLNYFFSIKKEFIVSKKQFIPEPKVDSVVVSFRERKNKLKLKNFDFFERVVRDSFRFKRKTIRNNLKEYDLKVIEKILNEYGFDLSVRAETLSVEVFVKISNALWK